MPLSRRSTPSLGVALLLCGVGACASHHRPGAAAPPSASFVVHHDTADVRRATEDIVADYARRFAAMGLPLGTPPQVVVRNSPQLIFFRGGTITVPFGPDMPPPARAMFADWAGGAAQGDTLVASLFNWLSVPHELTHWFQGRYGSVASRLESERMANEFAVAYWMERGEEPRLAALERTMTHALAGLPNPTPAGVDEERYFAEHYAELGADPRKYAYYQFRTGLDALARRHTLHLAAMARAYAARPRPADATVSAPSASGVVLSAERLARYVGEYALGPAGNFVVTLQNGTLLGDFPVQPGTKHAMQPLSETEFDVGERYHVVFELDAGGTATHASLRQGDQTVWRATRRP